MDSTERYPWLLTTEALFIFVGGSKSDSRFGEARELVNARFPKC